MLLERNKMNVLYSNQSKFSGGGPSIFLVGPTPRSANVASWRPEAIKILADLNFKGTVLVPEWENFSTKTSYEDQVDWERAGLENADIIACWVPRNMETMPALTTNVEFGFWLARAPHKIRYGRPDDSVKNRYLDWLYFKETNRYPHNSLKSLLELSLHSIETQK